MFYAATFSDVPSTLQKMLKLACFFFKKKSAIHCLFFTVVFSTANSKYVFIIKFCQRLDSNRGPLVSEPTALPTELQPLAKFGFLYNLIATLARPVWVISNQNCYRIKSWNLPFLLECFICFVKQLFGPTEPRWLCKKNFQVNLICLLLIRALWLV